MKAKELLTMLLELRDMELNIIVENNYCDYDIDTVKINYGWATIKIKNFEKYFAYRIILLYNCTR